MSLRSYTGPAPTVYPSPFALGFSWVLALGTVALQIAYPLVDETQRADLAAITVVVFFLASVVHATACHRWRGFVRLLELARDLVGGALRGVEARDISVAEARAAREMLLIGSSIKVAPIVEWDGKRIGEGTPGPASSVLRDLLERDMRSGRDRLIDIPY